MPQNCPLCASPSTRVFEVHGYDVLSCQSCQHRFAAIDTSAGHVEQHYSDDYFFSGGAGYHNYLEEGELLIRHGTRYGNLLNRYMESGTLLDVGAAAGFILKGLVQSGWTGKGLEPNASMATHGRDKLGLDIETGTLEQYACRGQFDALTMIQVVGHFYDIADAMAVVSLCVRRGGLLLIESWNRVSLPARVLGKNWHEYSPPTVLHWFSPEGLRTLLESYGFEQIAHGKPAKFLSGAHAKSLLIYKLEQTPMKGLSGILNLVPDGIAIPYPSFDLFWALYRRKEEHSDTPKSGSRV